MSQDIGNRANPQCSPCFAFGGEVDGRRRLRRVPAACGQAGTPGLVVKEGTDLSTVRAQGVRAYTGPRSYAELQALQDKAMTKPVPNMSAGIDVRKNVVRVEAPAAFWESANGNAVAAMDGIEKVVTPPGIVIRPAVSMPSWAGSSSAQLHR